MSKIYSLQKVQRIPASIEQVWDFFSNHINLQEITPGNMHFKIISKYHSEQMHAGQIIEYTLKLFLGIPVYWMTEITHVEPMKYFVDEQRYGPYAMWHHQHRFKEIEHGVEMTDIVHYKIPYWFFGDIANAVFVKAQLAKIFDFRYAKVEGIFGKYS